MSDLPASSASQLAGRIRAGELSAREAVEESLRRIDDQQTALNAFTWIDHEGALAAADAVAPGDPRPFAGVPIAVKDLGPAVNGWPLTFGSDFMGDTRPPFDSFLTRRLREAGFVLVGRTNTPEFGIVPVTEPRRYGPARNPWNRGHTPGGSSGGSAAAVAAGLVPIAHGNDGGGSIRVPAAACGLVGLKPARNRISLGPLQGGSIFAVEGALTRTVADTARMLDVLAGYEPGDESWPPPPARPFATAAATPPGTLRIARTVTPPLPDTPIDPAHVAAVDEAAALLERLGHEVEDHTPAWGGDFVEPAFSALWAAQLAFLVKALGAIAGREPAPEAVEPLTWWLVEQGRALDAVDLQEVLAQLGAYTRAVVGSMAGYDAVLCPTLGVRPYPVGTIDTAGADLEAEFAKAVPVVPFTVTANATGLPAISLPWDQGSDGLPTAVQLYGGPADEATLLALAAQIEEARPWADRRPPEA
jgi:amidase